MFQRADSGDWSQIDKISALIGGRAIRMKTLSTYFPNDVLPIHSYAHLVHFLNRVGQDGKRLASELEVVGLNRALLETLQAIPELNGWTTGQMERFLYWWASPSEGRNIVKIAPGENGRFWEDCLNNGYICVGWDAVGDLEEYTDYDAFYARFVTHYPYDGNASQARKKANELWTLNVLEPGDIVIANRGVSEILGIGEVIEPSYVWKPERSEYKHIVSVKWSTEHARKVDFLPRRWQFVTVAKVDETLYRKIMTNTSLPEREPEPILPARNDIAEALERKGQVILYGPPGTGKTYHALAFRRWWEQQSQMDRKTLDLANPTQRTWWIVASPNQWKWEKLFVDGTVRYRFGRLQKNYSQVQPGDLVIGYQANPDKRIMALARVKALTDNPEEPLELEPLQKIENGLTYAELLANETLKLSEPMRFHCQGTLFALKNDEAEYLLSLLAERDPKLNNIVDEPIKPQRGHVVEQVTFHPSYSYEDFIEGFRPVDTGSGLVLRLEDGLFKRLCRIAQANPQSHYLLIIDEINRANVAKVFGEIITLLEKDKRTIEIELPQSRERFQVPRNVYILGTMNTADKSIRLLDAALRRRFAFIEFMPETDLLEGSRVDDLELGLFLEFLNQRITKQEGREKQIGHAFLMDGADPIQDLMEFARRFRQEILPLLQEYCYDDYGELAAYLGTELIDPETETLREEIFGNPELLVQALARHIASAPGQIL
jgi:5-methylcytosine-specific restriction protein B